MRRIGLRQGSLYQASLDLRCMQRTEVVENNFGESLREYDGEKGRTTMEPNSVRQPYSPSFVVHQDYSRSSEEA